MNAPLPSTTPHSPWHMARRAARMNPSVIREILKVTERPGIISFAGGLPSPKTFPVAEFEAACAKVLKDDPQGALQYAASEGYGPLREMVAEQLRAQAATADLTWAVDPAQVLITTGSQQGLDLVAKVLIDAGSKILVESPTYLGAVSAFIPMEPEVVSVASDAEGVDIEALRQAALAGTNWGQSPNSASQILESDPNSPNLPRFLYVLPNFQNPTGNTMSEARRAALSATAAELNLPLIEDNPYGDLWFETPPPASLTARNPEGCIYLGSFSKVLAPGLRLGFMVAPKAVYPKLLQAKQAADLHSPGFNQRMIAEVMKDGFLNRHVPTIRALYKAQRDAMLEALAQHFPESNRQPDQSLTWNTPAGGMFLWARLPKGMSAVDLLPLAVDKGVAFVPGAPFYADHGDQRSLRLSFVTPSVEEIHRGVAALASAIRQQQGN